MGNTASILGSSFLHALCALWRQPRLRLWRCVVPYVTRRRLISTSTANRGQAVGGGDVNAFNCLFDSQSGGNDARRGGAIASFAGNQTFVVDSTFDNNGAGFGSKSGSGFGGAIYAQSSVTVISSLFYNNRARNEGGAIYVPTDAEREGFALSVRNSTLTVNSADELGSAVRNAGGTVSLQSCTLTANSIFNSQTGGALSNAASAGAITGVTNTIIAGNSGSDVSYDSPGVEANRQTIASGGYNLIGTGNAVSSFGAAGDLTAVTNPKLNRIGTNGGNSRTVAPMPYSPAINAGSLGVRPITGSTSVAPVFPACATGASTSEPTKSKTARRSRAFR